MIGLLAIGGVAFGAARVQAEERSIGYTELSRIAADGSAKSVQVDGERFVVERTSGEKLTAIVDDRDARHTLVERFVGAGVPLTFDGREPTLAARLGGVLGGALALGALGTVFVMLEKRRRRAGFVALSGSEETGPRVRFSDVAGMDEVKEALTETVEFLKSPDRFGRLGGRAPRGVLLTGGPGTGKTLLARAVASEAGVPFLSASGSSFQEMFVGVGAARVRSLFAEARKSAPCIVYIDEIDAVGRARGRGGDSASGDHDQTLNQLLVEMDGFDHTTGIVVMASTNRADILDPAIVRPGRFDRQIVVPLPDLRGRHEILEVHARPIELTADVDLLNIAKATPGFSGAELANLLNEAAILAAREGAAAVEVGHIERARDRVIMGMERKGVLVDDGERHATAVHEAGHVAVGVAAEHTDPVHKVSILPRGRALGVTCSLPEKDRLMYRREYLEDQICLMLGGRAAEMEILGTMTAGAADDIERAAGLARRMVAELGMSDLGPICLKDGHAPHSEALLSRVEETTRRLLDDQLARARHIVRERRDEIAALVSGLLERETLDADEILACFPRDAKAAAA
ncbi:Cell division protein FtsH [Minicystis rosea]|nr:Cell division protein FtsH [Minicystis rosea]